MFGIFYECKSLISLPNISKWNLNNVKVIKFLFYECSSLEELPDISNWNISNVQTIEGLFYECSSLKNYLIFQNGIQVM